MATTTVHRLDGLAPAKTIPASSSWRLCRRRQGAPYTLAFMASQGSFALSGMAKPDERAFKSLPDGGVVAAVSGLRCPDLTGYQRVELVVTGAPNGGVEAGCRYASERSRIAVFATSIPASMRTADFNTLFQIMFAPALADGGESGTPPETSPPPVLHPLSAASFSLKEGAQEAFWGFKRGAWVYEIYALYGKESQSSVGSAATALLVANSEAR